MEMLSDSRTVLVTGKGRAQIRKDASPDAKMVGLADPGAVLQIESLRRRTLAASRASDVDGWIPQKPDLGRGRGRECSNRPSMPEVAHAGEHHRQSRFVGGVDHFLIVHRTARLDHRRGARFGHRQQAVREGKEGFRRRR